jgi:4-diphosphocytidyl-2-C-methyl-D-erythritol kinase
MLTITAPAKINLVLDVLNKRPDGYHEVDMVLQSIVLADQVSVAEAPEMMLVCSDPRIPDDWRNLAWKAAALLQKIYNIKQNVFIRIAKKIPLAAGLAGGSADAAAVLLGLNQLWKLGLSVIELTALGVKLGADVPFCLRQGTMRAQGIGEQLTPVSSIMNCRVLLVTPDVAVSTALVYNTLIAAKITDHPDVNMVCQALEQGDLNGVTSAWGNVLEEVVLPRFPQVRETFDLFRRYGLEAPRMSGSGPSVFALDPPEETAKALIIDLPPGWFGCVTDFSK